MNQDETILLFSFLVYWMFLIVLVFNAKNKRKIFIINFIVHLFYSAYFLYGLYYRSQGGTSLAWLFFLLLLLWTHSLVNFAQLIYFLIKGNKIANRK